MEYPNSDDAKTPDQCAEMFCRMIRRLLTFVTKQVVDDECLAVLEGISSKFRLACDTLLTQEEILEKVGVVIYKWGTPIRNYDDKFFMQTDLMSLFNDANIDTQTPSSIPASDSLRERFARALNQRSRTTILDALNLMLILYARYRVLCSKPPARHNASQSK